MTEDYRKKGPRGVPIHFLEMEAKVCQAVQIESSEQDISVVMTVSGGLHGEHYDFHFRASSKGVVECGFQCQMSNHKHETQKYKLPREAFAKVLETINIRELAMVSEQQVLFPPDSLVGQLEISDGEQTIRTVFMADPGQAETADYKMPPSLSQTTDAIYELAAHLMGIEDVRPYLERGC